jgi:hypothetical protein
MHPAPKSRRRVVLAARPLPNIIPAETIGRERKTWMAGSSPAMTKKMNHIHVVKKSLQILDAFSVNLSRKLWTAARAPQ